MQREGDDTDKRGPASHQTKKLGSGRATTIPAASPPPGADATRLIKQAPLDRAYADGSSRPAARGGAPLRTGTMIGRFELVREIARGGMGQIYLGRDIQLGRKVAIKFLLEHDDHFLQRFLIEARATARCTHENIVTIYEVGEYEGLPYMVLEYLEGKTLFTVLDSSTPSPRQFVELMLPVVRALERAHSNGIVHRDLKPQNIFVTDHGQVKVLDFGIARLVDRNDADIIRRATAAMEAVSVADDDVDMMTADNHLGTLPYMSPEQFGLDEVDHLSDIWAVGILFWAALTGAHPAGPLTPYNLQVQITDIATPFPSITSHDPTIPRELAAIIDRCLAKRKAQRYPTASALLADLQAFLVPTADRAVDEDCPYRGLSPFGEDDAKLFFGRSNEIRTAVAQLASWPLLAVIGPSGVGKSSFVHAGLVPALRATADNWRVHMLRPGRVPFHRLVGVFEDTMAPGEDPSELMRRLLEGPGVFGAMLRANAARRNERILLVIDQFEELFTLCDSEDLRRLFLSTLLAAADDPACPIRIVLSMRADFLDRLATHKTFLSELSRGLLFLSAPGEDNLRETLERPAELAGYAFEDPSIVEDMMQVATSRGALPLLSFAASRLWEMRDRQRRLLTVAAYDSMGGIGGAFARHADNVVSAVHSEGQPLLRAIMMRLVTPDGTRAVVDHKDLLSLSADPKDVERILDQLVRARLIQLHTEPDQPASVEIVHEMLISEWPTLRRWLDDTHAARALTHELRQASKQWIARGKPNDLVWRGATAQEALRHARRHTLELSANEQQFLTAIEMLAARTRRRRLLALTSIAVALALVLAGGTFALVKIKMAETAAQEEARQAVRARQSETAAKEEAQLKVEAYETERKAREMAEREKRDEEQKRKDEEQKRRDVEEDLADTKKQSLEQVQQQLKETEAARQREAKANEELRAQKKETERLYAKEKAAREKAEAEARSKGIATKPLIPGAK